MRTLKRRRARAAANNGRVKTANMPSTRPHRLNTDLGPICALR